ncbi:MAG: glycosyltransferase family 2 protein [Cytophagales bacterium]
MNILFSIIIPSYNQGHFIKQTIDSILDQSYKNVEILVIDGGSTDHTVEILKGYNEKIFWLSENDRGQTHAINKGIALAKGNIITYLNSDDYYLVDTLQNVKSFFEANKDRYWLTGDYIIVDKNGNRIQSIIGTYKSFFRRFLSFNLLSVLNPVNQPSTFLTRDLIAKVGLFNEEYRYVMDYDYWMRAIKIQKPIIVKNKLAAFRIHSDSKGGSQYKKQFEEELVVADKYQPKIVFKWLHRIHILLINLIYKILK